ncbi:hypothetical protein [Pseudomonas akapageensis]|uniref:hypothetical protein n=1 Tax=Pseudomonas akapageensis TaxID=2609961 RepID=UPI00140AACF8|nr:hypothetical protein [Pseudomonas akapageensis]
MKNVKSLLTAVVFALAGVAVHANAATESQLCASGTCFQLTPLAQKEALPALASDGSSKTPLGMQLEDAAAVVAENGSSKTPLGMQLEGEAPVVAENGSSKTPLGMQLDADAPVVAENGFQHTPLGMQLEHQVESA